MITKKASKCFPYNQNGHSCTKSQANSQILVLCSYCYISNVKLKITVVVLLCQVLIKQSQSQLLFGIIFYFVNYDCFENDILHHTFNETRTGILYALYNNIKYYNMLSLSTGCRQRPLSLFRKKCYLLSLSRCTYIVQCSVLLLPGGTVVMHTVVEYSISIHTTTILRTVRQFVPDCIGPNYDVSQSSPCTPGLRLSPVQTVHSETNSVQSDPDWTGIRTGFRTAVQNPVRNPNNNNNNNNNNTYNAVRWIIVPSTLSIHFLRH